MASIRKQFKRRLRARAVGQTFAKPIQEKITMLYFRTRTLAREFASTNDAYTVVDKRDEPNVNGLGWAVKVL